MSLRSPLGKVLGLGTAKDGTAHFMGQRISAVAIALLGCWFVAALFNLESFTYLDVLRFITQPTNSVLLVLLVLTLSYHSWLGIQVVIEDYVHAHGVKLLSLIIAKFAHILVATAAVYAILKIGIGP